MDRRTTAGPLLLILIVAVGLIFAVWQPVEVDTVFAWGERLAGNPLTLALLVVVQILLFTFALPGSTVIWAIAPFLPPWIAVPVLVSGATAGAVGAYFLSGRLSRDWRVGPASRRVIGLLEQRGDFLTQTALRALPGFPHSIVNYAGGILRLPLPGFIAAALVGLGVKWWVYASAIHGLATAARGDEALGGRELLPLFILAVLLLIAGLVKWKLRQRSL
ncbi:VTT domain-containing protein [Gammaproteobacteria bacterium AB-CW1]|uniref:TVP38/TMEM64 family membrane protein n=1 Tax=Natronospira elongata TaxID=3110268 RepID=A0AAP6MKT1_9GAMM|nr:VTT domain-containing protein [Gammaproteobacteria bacterium AB-CW1]